jgi:TorA maturation chaperone TorD
MSGGTVWSKVFLEKLLSEEMARFYAAELTLAVEFVHKYGVGHR